MIASAKGQLDVVQILLDLVMIAAVSGHVEVVRILLEAVLWFSDSKNF